ncbi:MAP3K1 [Lepeophtheirus salmonis]|uniref:MAP3K1 n=1 Tax=Lepeophtheirus salmonis TaxID=72036 RepID=A0A7R8CSR1_LEPSM|nr:MAP3K1 [Lepeophtheirus salmonis]CAF2919465.1 MAP3K1 [Lepeophtheirus salmonis]
MLPVEDSSHKCSKSKGVGLNVKSNPEYPYSKGKKNTPGYETVSPSRNAVTNTINEGRLTSPTAAYSPSLTPKRRKGSLVSPSGFHSTRSLEKQDGIISGSTPSNNGSPLFEVSSPFSSNNKLFSSKDSSPSCSQASYNSPSSDYSTKQLWTLPEIGGPEIYFSGAPDTISRDNWSLASSWISVVGRDLTGCLLSKDWSLRETGLKGLSRALANTLNQHRHSVGVYQGALKALQTMITLTHCPCFLSESEFKSLLKPLIQKIVVKCSDGKRRVADLSYSVISELCKGASGELAPGKHIYHERAHLCIENEYFQKIIFEPGGESSFASTSWQWILGVSVVLDKLLDENEEDLLNQNFVLMIINFAFKNLNHSHANVSKLSRRILVKAAKVSEVSIFHYVWNSLSSLDLTLQSRIKKELGSHYNRISSTTEHLYLKAVTLSQEVAKGMNLRKLKESVLKENLPYDTPSCREYDELYQGSLNNVQQHILIHPHTILMEGALFGNNFLYLENRDWTKGPLVGACFQARDMRTGTLMAVKQIPLYSHTAEASLSEVELLSNLGFNPHIIRLLGAIRENNSIFNVFIEWMSGGSISHILDIYGAFEERVIVGYVRQLLSGLDFLHSNTVLHRDIKGANLLLDTTGHHLKIGDFGAAVFLNSPLIPKGSDCELRDIWSVGCCIIEMATQKPPWNTSDISNHLALIYKIAQSMDPPKIPNNLSVDCLDFLLSCLQINQDERPSAAQLLEHRVF